MEDNECIRKAAEGDRHALAVLLQQNYAFLRKYLLKVTLNPQLAEDIAQETMLKCVEKIKLYNGQSKFSSWLITIATRLFIDHGRRQKRERLWQEQALRSMKWEAAYQNSDWPEVIEALSALSEEMRTAIILKHYYGYTYEEIGGMLSLSEGTVKSRVHHGIKQLRKEFDAHETDRA